MFEKLGKSLDELVRSVSNDVKMTKIDTKTESISVPYPEVTPAQLRLEVGVGKLALTPGGSNLVEGTVTYNVAEWAPEVTTDGDKVTVRQGHGWHILGGWDNVRNEWALALGTTKPFALSVAKGVGESEISLGGTSLSDVSIETGTGKTTVRFDKANPVTAEAVSLKTGTGSTKLDGLLNANTPLVTVDSGTGEVALNFTGDNINQDVKVKINSGTGQVVVNVKTGVPFRAVVNKGFGSVKTRGAVQASGDHMYETSNYSLASGPKIVLDINTGMGSVVLNSMDTLADLFE